MIRQQRSVRLIFPEEARANLVDGGSRTDPGSLVVHVRPRGLFARWTPLGSMDNPPVFRGKAEPTAGGFAVTGTIRDTRAHATTPLALLLSSAVGIVLFVLGLTGTDSRALLITVGLLLTVLFAVRFVRSLRRRRPQFRLQAGQLEHGLDTYVRTGAVPVRSRDVCRRAVNR